jgi:hypothetical protein
VSAGAGALAGSVRWGVVPFAPRPPFRLYGGEGRAPLVVPEVSALVAAAQKGGDAELTYLVPGKVRPVLVLNDPIASEHREVTALRLLRLSRVTEDERRRIKQGEEELLFYLDPSRFDLPEENAAMVTALVRVHADAVDATRSLGEVNVNEMRLLGEKIIEFYRFDTRLLIEKQIRTLAARRRSAD